VCRTRRKVETPVFRRPRRFTTAASRGGETAKESPVPRTYYRKLVRDRIPEIVAAGGLRCRTRTLSPTAYARALREKVLEEARELVEARGRDAVLNELADLRELLDSFRRLLGVGPDAFERIVRRKRLARGGFRKRLLLDYTEKPR